MHSNFLGCRAKFRNTPRNEKYCLEQNINLNEVVGFIEKIDNNYFVNVNGKQYSTIEFPEWSIDILAPLTLKDGVKVKLMDAPINKAVCDSIGQDLIGFEGTILLMDTSNENHRESGLRDGYYVVGEQIIIFMNDFIRWEVIE